MTVDLYKTTKPFIPGNEFSFPAFLFDADALIVPSPVLQAGDVLVSRDGGPYSNIASLPTCNSQGELTVALSALETTGIVNYLTVLFKDQSSDQSFMDTVFQIFVDSLVGLPTASETRQEMDSNSTELAAIKGAVDSVLEDTGSTLDTLIKDIPTNAELESALVSADDAVLAAIEAIPSGISAEDVWEHPGRTLTNLTQVSNLLLEDLEITAYRGDAFTSTLQVADMGATEPGKIWVGIKSNLVDADDESLLMVTKAGCTVVVGRDPLAGETALITWIDSTHVQLDISAEIMALLPIGSYPYDIQIEGEEITTVANGTFHVFGDVVREV